MLRKSPDEVRAYSEEVLTLSVVMGKDPNEVSTWDERDRRWLLVVHGVKSQVAAKEK